MLNWGFNSQMVSLVEGFEVVGYSVSLLYDVDTRTTSGYSYHIPNNTRLSWSESLEYCKSLSPSSTIAVIDNDRENGYILSYLSDVIGNTSALSPAPDFIGWLGVKVESEEYLTTHGASQTFFMGIWSKWFSQRRLCVHR
ncbi:hypothetical protein EB796_016554 [Bugula neritina]|uniref:C-type lectin domain-containing protein n=1 Tax=Bugula neritina TaxID=10212 RepID=A0A7J7JIF0_BUGNE|nr:hypothetical protein EB796_016554 [Bugula neritina]